VSISFKLPSVIRLLSTSRSSGGSTTLPFSRADIYARDENECQYCGDGVPHQRADVRSRRPVAQGRRKDWENIVTCCVTLQPAEGRPKAGRSTHAPRRDIPQAPPIGSRVRLTVGSQERAGKMA